jgi:hypothetical protein
VEAHALFGQIVDRYGDDPAVTPPGEGKKFGATGLKVDNKLFAMVSKGELVLKLPRGRVDELIAEGKGTRFDPGHGRLMKEWVSVGSAHGGDWPALADEARDFVSGRR